MEHRLKFLTGKEVQELYSLPHFTYEERMRYFSLDPLEEKELENLRKISSKIYFILQLGYFKAKKMFFSFDIKEVQTDIKHIHQKYFLEVNSLPVITITMSTRLFQQACILKLLNYQDLTKEVKRVLQEKAYYLATIFTKPVYIFKELMHYLESQRIVIPVYSFMQDIIGKALANERVRLESAILQHLSEANKAALNKLLCEEDGLYGLTFLKKEPKDFSYKEITQEVHKRESLKNLYDLAQTFLSRTGISNENIKYYAFLVGYYTVYKLKRMKCETAYIYLLCFLFNRYQKINDNLVDTFLYYVSNYINEAKQVAKEKIYEYKMEGNNHLKDIGKILDLFIDENISEKIEFCKVKEIAFDILEKEKFPLLSKYLSKAKFDDSEYEWDYYVELSRKFKRNLRYIFLNIDFEGQSKVNPLLQAVSFLKDSLSKNKRLSQFDIKDFPQEFVPPKLRRYLYETKDSKTDGKTRKMRKFSVDKYEFMIYRFLKIKLESGEVFVKESINFKSFEEDLIDNEKWKNKDQLIKSLGLSYLHEPIDTILASFEETLEKSLHTVNSRIKEGQNPHIKITEKGGKTKWTLPYTKSEELVNNPIYDRLRQVAISDLLHFVDEKCGYMAAFTHVIDKYVKSQVDSCRIFAVIVAYGTNIGLSKMADISDMGYSELVSTSNNYIRLDTLQKANDQVSNAMAKLSIFKHYNIKEDLIHSSSDGQKYETQFNTINSRYSPKYFGLNKGITSYTLVANHIPVNAKIIGANEHESHYVFDLLFNNTSEINPNIHSTDTPGTNEVNFAILHIFGYTFAPRYKKLSSKAKIIYGFKNLTQYEDCLLKPIRKINTKLIKEEWENIQRIIVSLALKSTTQSIVIRKLSSYARKNKTKKALWEYDNVIKTLYILDYGASPKCPKGS